MFIYTGIYIHYMIILSFCSTTKSNVGNATRQASATAGAQLGGVANTQNCFFGASARADALRRCAITFSALGKHAEDVLVVPRPRRSSETAKDNNYMDKSIHVYIYIYITYSCIYNRIYIHIYRNIYIYSLYD